jgi:hypothetical protein
MNSLALKISEERAALGNTTYSNNLKSWKVPEVEIMSKTFNEGNRFFNTGTK